MPPTIVLLLHYKLPKSSFFAMIFSEAIMNETIPTILADMFPFEKTQKILTKKADLTLSVRLSINKICSKIHGLEALTIQNCLSIVSKYQARTGHIGESSKSDAPVVHFI